ncbi:hypothetical protein FALCPG4_005039 [Fusarium falciforme]
MCTSRRSNQDQCRISLCRSSFCSSLLLDNGEKLGSSLEPNTSRAGWTEERKFDEGTLDEHKYTISLTGDAKKHKKYECLSSFKRIIHGCDKEDDDNPLSWKHGGSWQRGQYEYRLHIKRKNRPQNLKEPFGTCRGNNHFWYVDYIIYGAGFSSWDHGKKTLLPSIKDCLGEGVTDFEFEYFDGPNQFGHEWLATFNTPGIVNSRCFKNNKVVIFDMLVVHVW